MTEEEKLEAEEIFIEWTTFIEDRVDEWSVNVPKEIAESLDYSPESLKDVEKYILANYNKDSLNNQENKIPIDALISYYSETLRRNLPNSYWHIELDDDSSIGFNSPCLKTPIGTVIPLYFLFKRVLAKNKGTFLYDFYVKRLGFINNPETY